MSLQVQHTYTSTIITAFTGLLLLVVIGIGLITIYERTAHAATPVVEPISPMNNSYATGELTLSSRVNGLDPNEYEMFWAVGNGQWNRMTTNTSTKISDATINISDWNWQSDKRYTLRFIALIKNGWYPIESSVTINKGSLAAAPLAIAPSSTYQAPSIDTSVTKKLFIDPVSDAAQRKATSPNNPTLNYLASQPSARWYGDWNANVKDDVSSYVAKAAAAQAIPTLVLYNIPHRDCGSYSAGGAQDYVNYQAWGKQVADGIAGRPAIVIVEPDALASLDCLTASDRTARMNAIAGIVKLIKTTQSKVYIDAGHTGWQSDDVMASRLKSSGIENADGFSLNVSNFQTNSDNIRYGSSLSAKLANAHFVVDTSRNGSGPATDGQWCNPTGRSLGLTPTLSTGNSLIDAYLWIKTPGDSDGACGGGAPAAGQWWQSYADALYTNMLRKS